MITTGEHTARFWYRNYRGKIEYRNIVIGEPAHYVANPGYGYRPGWVVSGYCLVNPSLPYRSFSLEHDRLWFAGKDGWTEPGNTTPVYNCAKVFGVDYATALHFAHMGTYATPLSDTSTERALAEVADKLTVEAARLFYGHLGVIAQTLLTYREQG